MAKISIIIPVYNSEKYIRRCLNSILNQTFQDFEIILIDDNSKDNSLKIISEIEKTGSIDFDMPIKLGYTGRDSNKIEKF